MKDKNLEEFINELNERLLAISAVQQFIVAFIAGASPKDAELLKEAIKKTIHAVALKYPDAKTLPKELKKYLDFIDRAPAKDHRTLFQVIEGGLEPGQKSDNPEHENE